MAGAVLAPASPGLVSALALTKHLDPKPKITIFEVRDTPSTIGGAVNLTPKALRYLDYLGIDARGLSAECKTIELCDLYTGQKYAEVDFRGADGTGVGKDASKKFFSARVLRRELQAALLKAVKQRANVNVLWGKQVETIDERQAEDDVQLTFKDCEQTTCDLLLGCDGIHSATRTLLIEPERQPTYTGISVCMAMAKLRPDTYLRWETTALVSSRQRSFMASYFERSRTEQ
ncbi:uncharacterized protein LTR77_003700 [Saxophila tyrrhenica]|uniref:FAD-binding domain-containing protein n=1 Tax=Saxophila tyrrhenica TaxID=1690608 RepID=A0AAV9PH03_9PEZI|nr:hypothetical protein LTR77_003700 [Saxophila tyrrhenica]